MAGLLLKENTVKVTRIFLYHKLSIVYLCSCYLIFCSTFSQKWPWRSSIGLHYLSAGPSPCYDEWTNASSVTPPLSSFPIAKSRDSGIFVRTHCWKLFPHPAGLSQGCQSGWHPNSEHWKFFKRRNGTSNREVALDCSGVVNALHRWLICSICVEYDTDENYPVGGGKAG